MERGVTRLLGGLVGSSLSLAFCAILAGCVTYQPQPLSLEKTAETFEARSLSGEDLRAFFAQHASDLAKSWPRSSWDLDALTMAAYYFHPDLEVARAQWAEARAAVMSAGARPNPMLAVTPGYDSNSGTGISPWFPAVGLDWPIETAGKRRLRVTQAEAQSEAARLNITTVAWQLRRALRTALIDYLSANRRLESLRGETKVRRQIVELVEQRRQFGAASTHELAAARLAAENVQIDLAAMERQEAEALSRLAEALGVPLDAVRRMHFDFELGSTPALPDSDEARRLALEQRADIRAALADYAAHETGLQQEIAKQYPDIHLGHAYQWDQGENKWSFGLGLELPVLNRNRGPIAAAEARRAESAAHFRSLQSKIIASVDRALADRKLASDQLSRAAVVRQAANRQWSLMRARLSAGDIDQLEYQNARLESLTGDLVLLDAQVNASRAAGEVEDALQVPSPILAAVSRIDSTPLKP